MGLTIKKTGLAQYAPGGTARLKVMIIGGPSVGKTRWSSFFPDPIYLDVEGGLASVADREVPYASVNNSKDMNDALGFLALECRKPETARVYRTVVVDTLDAYQRKIKNEWMERNRTDAFTGWEAWGYLGTRMQSLMTKLLNLDMNVIVCVHYKDKITKDDDTGRETHEFMLQLSGEIADTAFNDFDFVGWMDEERRVIDGKPTAYRYVTFEKSAQKPFLKDRQNVLQGEFPVTFSDQDYKEIMARITARMDGIAPTVDVGEIPTFDEHGDADAKAVRPEQTPPAVMPRRDTPLESLDKPTLTRIAKEEGVTVGVDGKPLRGNSLKSELVEAIKWHRQRPPATPVVRPAAPSAPAPEPIAEPDKSIEQKALARQRTAAQYRENAPAETVNLPAGQPTIKTEAGRVNPGTGEIVSPAKAPQPAAQPEPQVDVEQQYKALSDRWIQLINDGAPQADIDAAEQAVEEFDKANPQMAREKERAARNLVTEKLGGTPVSRSEERVAVPERQAPTPPSQIRPQTHKYADENCKMCGKSLADEPFQPIQLGWIKFRALLCEEHFIERRDAAKK